MASTRRESMSAFGPRRACRPCRQTVLCCSRCGTHGPPHPQAHARARRRLCVADGPGDGRQPPVVDGHAGQYVQPTVSLCAQRRRASRIVDEQQPHGNAKGAAHICPAARASPLLVRILVSGRRPPAHGAARCLHRRARQRSLQGGARRRTGRQRGATLAEAAGARARRIAGIDSGHAGARARPARPDARAARPPPPPSPRRELLQPRGTEASEQLVAAGRGSGNRSHQPRGAEASAAALPPPLQARARPVRVRGRGRDAGRGRRAGGLPPIAAARRPARAAARMRRCTRGLRGRGAGGGSALGRGRHLHAEPCGGPLGAARQADLAVQCGPPARAVMALVALAGIASEPEVSVHAAARIVIASMGGVPAFSVPWSVAAGGPPSRTPQGSIGGGPRCRTPGRTLGRPPARLPQATWNRPAANP